MTRLENWMFQTDRLRRYGGALLAAYLAIFALHIWLRDWPSRANGHPRFVDFVSFWVNARFALTAAAAQAYDYATFAAAQMPLVAETHGDLPYYKLVYPPTLFPLIAPFGLLPFVASLAAWIAATGALYVFAIRRIVPRPLACLLALLPAAAAKTIWLGQTGFLVAGLLGLTLGSMEASPFLAGLCLGLLSCKPQYGLMFPIVLLASGQWRAIGGACVSVAALSLAATVFYGPEVWEGYLRTFQASNLNNFMTDADVDAIDQTVFGVMHWAGAGFATKWAVHTIAAACVAALVCAIWRRPVSPNLKAAALGVGALAVTPYMLAYDLTALTVPAAFLIAEGFATGFRTGERLTLLCCWAALFLMQAMPVGPFVVAAMLTMVCRRVFGRTVAIAAPSLAIRYQPMPPLTLRPPNRSWSAKADHPRLSRGHKGMDGAPSRTMTVGPTNADDQSSGRLV